MMRSVFVVLLLLLLPLPYQSVAFAQDDQLVEQTEQTAPEFPGLGEVVPRATSLKEDAAATLNQLQQLADPEVFHKRFNELVPRLDDLKQRISGYGPVESWYFDRQLEVSSALKALDQLLHNLQEDIAAQLNEIGTIHDDWAARLDFWNKWDAQLKADQGKRPTATFAEARKSINSVLTQSEKSSPALVALQQQLSTMQQEIQDQLGKSEAAFQKLRGDLFTRNSHPLVSTAFWAQFNDQLWQTTRQGISSLLQVREDFYRRNALTIGLQFLFVLIATLVIVRYRSRVDAVSSWQIFTQHPFATSLFASVVLFSFLYPGIPPLFRLFLSACGLGSATQLLRGVIVQRQLHSVLYMFVLIVLLTFGVRLIGLPLPYYRVFLLLLNLILLPLFVYLFRACQKLPQSGRIRFWLRLLLLLPLAALWANIIGYGTLGQRLIEASLESIVVVLFALISFQIGLGALGFLFARPVLKNNQVIYNFSRDFKRRCVVWLKVGLFTYTGLYLTTTWGFYSTTGKALDALTGFEVNISDYQLTLKTVLQVLLVLYLSLEISWLLQVMIDQQLFERRQYDRGVRDSVKKLMHYLLVLIGFLFAASVAGFQLQNLMVLAGAFGIGIGFGLQDIVNNFISGIILLFERPIKVGDGVLIDGDYGTVLRIGLRSTVVETLDQAELIVPNAQMISQKVTNWTFSNRRVRIVVPVGVAYGSDVPLVMKLLQQVGADFPEALKNPEPVVYFKEFGDSSLNFELRVWIDNIDHRPRVLSELLQAIDKQFREHQVEIPFPQRDLHLRSVDGEIFKKMPSSE